MIAPENHPGSWPNGFLVRLPADQPSMLVQDAGDLPKRAVHVVVGDVMEHRRADDDVEAAIGKRQLMRAANLEVTLGVAARVLPRSCPPRDRRRPVLRASPRDCQRDHIEPGPQPRSRTRSPVVYDSSTKVKKSSSQ